MRIAQALIASLMGMASIQGAAQFAPEPPMHGFHGRKNRKVDHLRIRAKELHHGYPGAKLARKAFLGEIGLPRS